MPSDALLSRLAKYKSLATVLYLTILPIFLVRKLLISAWRFGAPRAWDGSGHFGIAQIYAASIFPDTFGWTFAHFGGMPFPNFYPPLFFWGVALLYRTHLVPFLTAFKLFILGPLLLIPAAIWCVAWAVSNRNRTIAFTASFISLYPLLISTFGGQTKWASGLDYFSTLTIGMYTQPLGFILFLGWCALYLRIEGRPWRFVLASVFMALAVLASFVNGFMSALIVICTLLFDLVRLRRPTEAARRTAFLHVASPLVAAALTGFWVVPVLTSYEYFVTRPFTTVIVTREMIAWFALAVVGAICWLRRPTAAFGPYIAACAVLGVVLSLSASAAPRWLPFQANRFSPTLYFLCSVPIAFLIVTVIESLRSWTFRVMPAAEAFWRRRRLSLMLVLWLIPIAVFSVLSLRPRLNFFYQYRSALAFYPARVSNDPALLAQAPPDSVSQLPASLKETLPADLDNIELFELLEKEHQNDAAIVASATQTLANVLEFARSHNDGRFLVEIPAQYRADAAAFDARAMNSYLGAQGNQTLTVVFREASPNSIFMFPQVGALSFNPDNFGFSSVLGDDIDFAKQPLARHLDRARLLGVRYLVINSEQMKQRLAKEPAIGQRYDFNSWTVFQLADPPPATIRPLNYRPALLVSSFSVKGRRSNESGYIRFAEEQFADDWFDDLLARAPSTNLDEIGTSRELDQFGALILDSYDCEQCDIVYRQLKDFATRKPLILLARDTILFNRIRYSIDEFPQAVIIEPPSGNEDGGWLENFGASRHYGDSVARQQWQKIRAVLESHKIPIQPATVSGDLASSSINIRYGGQPDSTDGVPVLISVTYNPRWYAEGGERIYPANPMFMLMFAQRDAHLVFRRGRIDRAAAWLSLFTLVGLLVYLTPFARRGLKRSRPLSDFDA